MQVEKKVNLFALSFRKPIICARLQNVNRIDKNKNIY